VSTHCVRVWQHASHRASSHVHAVQAGALAAGACPLSTQCLPTVYGCGSMLHTVLAATSTLCKLVHWQQARAHCLPSVCPVSTWFECWAEASPGPRRSQLSGSNVGACLVALNLRSTNPHGAGAPTERNGAYVGIAAPDAPSGLAGLLATQGETAVSRTLGISGGRTLTRPFRDARRFPSTRL
jgi:hypothetical protein